MLCLLFLCMIPFAFWAFAEALAYSVAIERLRCQKKRSAAVSGRDKENGLLSRVSCTLLANSPSASSPVSVLSVTSEQ